MFASHEKKVSKKTFQKPNILRRKTKQPIPKSNISNESPEARSLVTSTHVEHTNIPDHLDVNTQLDVTKSNVTKSVWMLTLANNCEDHETNSQETDIDANRNSNASNKNVGSLEQESINIESFINSSSIDQDTLLSYDGEKHPTQTKTKWCFDVTNNSMDVIINNYREDQLGDLDEKLDSVIVVPSETTSYQQPPQDEIPSATPPTQTISIDYFSNRAVKFKCDHPNCNKGFWSEHKLNKHKNSHNRPVSRTPTQVTIECPVKKKGEDGSEERCPRTFEVRSDLLKHLDEDHTLDDAPYRCNVCGRRFFWALGLRAHGASVCARGGLACAWPGCGRVFRLPCRLREHARAHTGDRPYLCRYPECGWAFRSASKLVRHARRHTDERRHACAECGRAFLRREHLRDHCARHHHPAARAAHLCTHPGCEQTFTNMSTLYLHMKKVHRKVEKAISAAVPVEQSATVGDEGENVYMVSLVHDAVVAEEDGSVVEGASVSVGGEGEGDAEGEVDAEGEGGAGTVRGGGAEWHAARTHCTWPLPRPPPPHYVLDDDAQVEPTEGYTVRTDLFLHGNVPIDEDSQHIVGAALSGGAAAAALDTDLCLIDTHPTIDLMQEELMYEDRVFLMNGEELT